MRLISALAILLAFTLPSQANYYWHPIVKPPIVAPPPPIKPADPVSPAAGGAALCTGGCPYIVGGIAIIFAAIVVHEILGPACASNTARNRANGWDQPAGWWRPYCPVRRVISVRG